MANVRLYDSTICRLCAEENESGEMLFTDDSEETKLSAMVNRYLPLKIHDDGKLPRTICPGCNIQLEATAQFFELLINGQHKIRSMWKQQVELERNAERRFLKQKNIDITLFNDPKLINKSFTIESNDQELIFNVIPNGSVYNAKNDVSLQMNSLNKPRKKRGRPPKCFSGENLQETRKNTIIEELSQEGFVQNEEFDSDKRGKREIKVPKRYIETVQGKELEKIFKEEDVYDGEIHVKCEPLEHLNTLGVENFTSDSEIIGHLVTPSGKNLREPVINKNRICINQQKSKLKKKQKFMCSHCGKSFTQRNKYIIHKSLHNTICVFECIDCKNQFPNKGDLLLHQKATGHTQEKIIGIDEIQKFSEVFQIQDSDNTKSTNKSTTTVIECTFKDVSSTITEKAKEAKNVEMEKEPHSVDSLQEPNNTSSGLKCEKCSKYFESKSNLETHIKVVHQGEKPFVCELCNKAFAYQTSLQGHTEIEHSNKSDKGFPCGICGKILNHLSSITYHKLTEHNDGRQYECNKCTKRFKHKQLLQRHQIVHSEDRPYPCESCSASFKTKANLLNHQSTHTGEKKHCCELCDTKFAHKTSLTLHYRTHTGQKPYKCDVCAKSFSQNGNLQEHMRIHTGEKPYCCDHCGRKFTTSSQFKLHVKRHTGERPWKCDYCPKSFLHKDTWKCHMRRHTGERPFECLTCKRKFTEQWALKKHLRLHTGEKPYTCEICQKAFADCSNLTKHKKVHKNHETREPNEIVNAAETENNQWQILPSPVEENVTLEKIGKVLPTNKVSEDDMSRVIYVTYQDPNNPHEAVTLQISKENLIADQLPNSDGLENNENVDNVDDSDIQFSILAADGNPIRLSVQQARQLLSDGHILNQLNNEQNQIQSLSSVLQNNSEIEIPPVSIEDNNTTTKTESTLQADAEAIDKILQNEDTDATTVTVNQINTGEQMELSDNQYFEIITADGQKLQYIKVNPLQLSSGLLTIV